MCMRVKEFKTEILKQDLTVYKQVEEGSQDNTVKSWFFDFIYSFGELYRDSIETSSDTDNFDVLEGLAWINEEDLLHIGTGFHSALTPDRYVCYTGSMIVECTIPKGSQVIYGRTELLVSNQIIINKIL